VSHHGERSRDVRGGCAYLGHNAFSRYTDGFHDYGYMHDCMMAKLGDGWYAPARTFDGVDEQ